MILPDAFHIMKGRSVLLLLLLMNFTSLCLVSAMVMFSIN